MQPKPIVIVNPTKFLGNLLIALGLIQAVCKLFDAKGQPYKLVFDESYQPLVDNLFTPNTVIYYPRKAIAKAGVLERITLYFRFLKRLRHLNAEKIVDLEGDSVSSGLSRLSGARRKIGPEGCHHASWYTELSAPKPAGSEFFKYQSVLACIAEVSEAQPHYGKLKIPAMNEQLSATLRHHEIEDLDKIVILHAGASKKRKLWPTAHWVALAERLQALEFSPVLIGAGSMDVETNAAINAALNSSIPDLVNELSLVELSQLIARSSFYVGNDSGPMHLATALNIPSIAIFGPTNDKLWGPLHASTAVMRGYECPKSCRNGHDCELSLRCLSDLTADAVLERFLSFPQNSMSASTGK